MAPPRLLLLLVAATLAAPADANVLYKSIAPNGVVQFSDTPPDGDAKIVEQRDLAAPERAAVETAPVHVASIETLMGDDAVARATAQVDLAEHALALARRGVWSPNEGVHLRGPARSAADESRIEYYKRGVLAARQTLLEVIKQRLAAATTSATTVASR
jgi:hypothetical protein